MGRTTAMVSVALGLALTACAGGAPEAVRPPSVLPAASHAAGEAVVDLWTMVDAAYQDSALDLEQFSQVAVGPMLAQQQADVDWHRQEDGSLQDGAAVVDVLEIITTDAGHDVTVCVDLTALRFNGVKPDRGELTDRMQTTYQVVAHEQDPHLFLVSDEDHDSRQPCD